jgi:hypothetical protein
MSGQTHKSSIFVQPVMAPLHIQGIRREDRMINTEASLSSRLREAGNYVRHDVATMRALLTLAIVTASIALALLTI